VYVIRNDGVTGSSPVCGTICPFIFILLRGFVRMGRYSEQGTAA
jgi:hypothetical protein